MKALLARPNAPFSSLGCRDGTYEQSEALGGECLLSPELTWECCAGSETYAQTKARPRAVRASREWSSELMAMNFNVRIHTPPMIIKLTFQVFPNCLPLGVSGAMLAIAIPSNRLYFVCPIANTYRGRLSNPLVHCKSWRCKRIANSVQCRLSSPTRSSQLAVVRWLARVARLEDCRRI